ncbi:MAG: DEAD/DEAH box helicase [Candidatus Nanopelagicales bacterium]
MDHGPAQFSPLIRRWFTESFPAPTPAQAGAWEAIASGAHTLVVAPTGSGKTLAAFLWAIDRLITEGPGQGTRVLYVSPLKALAVDIERNLRSPLAGLMRLDPDLAPITVGVRTGDTSPMERRRLVTHPPDILITTPESLFLMLTSGARDTLGDVDTVIVDEVHALAGNKRGSHLTLSLARLDRLAPDIQRIGCSATVRPVEVVADFLTGGREARVVAPPPDKDFDLTITVPVPDLANPPVPADDDEARNPSIWPHVEQAIVDRIEHTSSTLVFTNSRRLSERLTTRLNELWLEQPEPTGPRPPAEVMAQAGASRGAEPVLARAHHGSVSRERRREIEDDLKAGRLRAVVATSTLELGIDMGAVDLVIQVQSPPGVASGLQRVGRAGHQVGAVSRAVVYPTHRGDLLAAAVTVDGMLAGDLEPVTPPRHPLDVLAQQIVAALAMDDWDVDDLYGLIRSAWPYRALPRSAYEGVLDMLAGRYPSEEFATLRPRILWDRAAGTLAGRPGTARLAVTNAGTIPDRGHFGVFLAGADRDRRVGELDEEMVYESRVGDVFALGSTSWRIEDITPDRVLVTPAPGAPARLPFWHGDTVGRPYPLGRALGEFLDRYASGDTALPRPLDPSATDNLAAYLDEQLRATGTLPGATAITIEQFTDELGDRRVILHSPFGARVHAPWALIIADRIENRFGIDGQVMAADDGIVLRLPDDGSLDSLPALTEVIAVDPDEVTSRLTSLIGGSALFASRFRECAARALLFPRRDPRRRSPLWQQRQRSAQLLSVAAGYPDFPIVLETVRECLQDVYDLEGLTDLLRALDSGAVRVTEVVTPTPSPFARSLLFGYVAAFLYEGDSPLAERKSAALALDDALLTELLGTADLRELLHPDALPDVEGRLQRLADRAATTTEAAWDMVRRIGPLRIDECGDRGLTVDRLSELGASRRVIRFHHAGGEWVAVSEDAGMLRDALGVALPTGLPEAFLEVRPDAARDLLLRFAGCHGPFTADDVAARFGLGVAVARDQLDSLTRSGVLLSGAFRPGGSGTEYVHPDVLRAVRRASAARYADEIEPVDHAAFAGFPARWQSVGVGLPARGRDGLLDVIDQLAGAPLPASQLESLILPSRVVDYDPALLDDLTTSGEVVWWALDPLPGDAWICLAPRDLAPPLLPTPEVAEADAPILTALGRGGWFADQLAAQLSAEGRPMGADDVDEVLQRLLWAGLITNDTLAPVRNRTGHKARPRRTVGRRRVRIAPRPGRTVTGRWSALPTPTADDPGASLAVAEILLNRHGLVTRGIVESERRAFAVQYRSLAALEDKGLCRRGYFVEGLGGAQFALSAAADEVRSAPGDSGAQVLAAADPAQPYGAALPWPDPPGGAGRPGRKAGAVVVLTAGQPGLYLERGGGSALLWPGDISEGDPATAVAALAEAVRSGAVPPLALKRINGVAPDARHIEVFEAAGAVLSPGGLRLRA